MAEYDYDGDGSTFPTPKANTNGSGSATFWDNSFKKLVDRTRWLKDNLTAAAATVAGYSGASFTIASGTVETFLRLLADKAAKLDATVNAFTGKMQVGASAPDPGANGLGVAGGITVGGASTLAAVTCTTLTVSVLKILAGHYLSTEDHKGTTTAATATIDVTTSSLWVFDGWHHAGHTLTATLADYAGSDNPNLFVLFLPTNAGSNDQILLQRNGGSPIVSVVKACFTWWRWDTSPTTGSARWRCMVAHSLNNDPGFVSVDNTDL